MLVLDRKIREGFWIGDEIFVKVLSVGKRRVKLGIEAPSGLAIVRSELRPESEDRASDESPGRHALSQHRDPSG